MEKLTQAQTFSPNQKNIDALLRMNFLYQSSIWLVMEWSKENKLTEFMIQENSNHESTNSDSLLQISRYYTTMMNRISEKTTQRRYVNILYY